MSLRKRSVLGISRTFAGGHQTCHTCTLPSSTFLEASETPADTTPSRRCQTIQCFLASSDAGAAVAAAVDVGGGNNGLHPHAAAVSHQNHFSADARGAKLLLLLLLQIGASVLPLLMLLQPGASKLPLLLLLRPDASMLLLLLPLPPGASILSLSLLKTPTDGAGVKIRQRCCNR